MLQKHNRHFPVSFSTKAGIDRTLKKITEVDNPLTVVENLGGHDMLMLMREADDEQKAELLALCTQEQFDALVDFVGWDGYVPTIERVEEMVAPLVSTGVTGALRAFDNLSNEFKTLMLKKYTIVHMIEDLNDPAPQVADTSDLIQTPDRYYFIEIPNAADCPEVVMGIISAILFKPFEQYHVELEAIRHDFQSDLEESALRWRNGRLADLGFGSYEDGLALLTPVDPLAIRRSIGRQTPPHPLHVDKALFPIVYRDKVFGKALLEAALEHVQKSDNPSWQQRAPYISAEIGAMTSLFLAGIKCDLADLDAVSNGAEMAADLLCLGLDAVSDGDVSEAAEALVYETPARLLQGAMGILVPMRSRAAALIHDKLLNETRLLDEPYRVVLEMLDKQIPTRWPLLFDNFSTAIDIPIALPNEIQVFSAMEQVRQSAALLDEMESLVEMFKEHFSLRLGMTIPFSSLALTILANAFTRESPVLEPLTGADAERFATEFGDLTQDDALDQAMTLLASVLPVDAEGSLLLDEESEPGRRALLRIVTIARERLNALAPREAFVLQE